MFPTSYEKGHVWVYRKDDDSGNDGGSDIGERLTLDPLKSLEGTYEFVDATVQSSHDYEYSLVMLGDGSTPKIVRRLPVYVGRLRWNSGITSVRPNPAFGPVTVAMEIRAKAHVAVDLIDVGGRQVRRLVEAEMDGGEHELTFDPRGANTRGWLLPAGVYYVVLRVDGRTEGNRVILLP
jgi:hypothetical protein